jgi:hypothetical protein
MKNSKVLAALSVSVIAVATLASTNAWGDSLDRTTVETQLKTDFTAAQNVQVKSLKENYWGLYKNYEVTFEAAFPDGTYRVSCNVVDRDKKDLKFNECVAKDDTGKQVDIAKYVDPKAAPRFPASQPGTQSK